MNDYVEALTEKYKIQKTAVYYRDLNNGPWYGYNEKEYFAPASLMKLPVMISLFKYAQDHPEVLEKRIIVKPADMARGLAPNIKPEKRVLEGVEYSMIDLVNYMIKESDNVAMSLVMENFPEKQYTDEIFQQVGVDTSMKNDGLVLRVKDYAGFYRVLYNASYLNKEYSELALKILSESTFNNGLIAGLPKDVLVAHKFGERDYGNEGLKLVGEFESGTKQMHDCGIIYYPEQPYILCVMTRGANIQNQESFIKDISGYIYNAIRD
jgi:beta-lactamase class A